MPGYGNAIEHRGERPIAITWRLNRSMPGRFSTRLRWLHAEGGPWARRMVTSPLVPRPWHARSVNRGEASCWLCEAAAGASTGELAFVLPLDGSMAAGHRLVVSRRHAADWWALTDGERQAVLISSTRCARTHQVQGSVRVQFESGDDSGHAHIRVISATAAWPDRLHNGPSRPPAPSNRRPCRDRVTFSRWTWLCPSSWCQGCVCCSRT